MRPTCGGRRRRSPTRPPGTDKFDKKLAEEEVWLRQGIKARRTRNEGRVRALLAMRAERAARRERLGTVRLQAEQSPKQSGKLVFEVDGISKRFDLQTADFNLQTFSARILRGDRIGLIGPNGAGKTTLLRLLHRRAGAGRGRGAARRQRPDRVLRSAARAARSGADGLRARSARATTRSPRTVARATCTPTCATSCSPTSARGRR